MKQVTSLALVALLAGVAVNAGAYEEGDWVLRLGATTVAPDEDSDRIVLPTAPATVLPGVSIGNDTQLGIIPVYMLTDNWGMELLAATPFEHDVKVKGAGIKAGSVTHLPPTLSLQWYPRGGQRGWQPYVGAGLNYTLIYDEDVDPQLAGALEGLLGASEADLSLDDSFGLSAQAGVDIPLSGNWAINLAVWYIDIDSTAKIRTDVGTVEFDVDIDPWVYNVGIAYRF
ncbi:MAG: OmpW family outer membrane protein [Haliea sp.]|uniref:OmpW/AlkL family protein n=1 Tax=Haliea sp. TaxID=1932666 RepID=UPI0032EAD02E